MFTDKTFLITGGTGSFGNAVLRRFLQTDVREIRIFSRDEKKQSDMRLAYHNKKLKFYLGDVRHPESLVDAMIGVDYVFHAAALKQVPSCEFYPMEALMTNAVGAENVMNAAIAAGVKHMVVLSTDKAAYPINAMGITKALMEKLATAKSRIAAERNAAIINITRYGNVMASRGSVIPLFVEQIKAGKPLTITDATMTRFMMSIDEAVDLVLYAFQHGRPGDLFVQKAPAATIETLAIALRKLFNSDVPIKNIGVRHGEKRHETLITSEEMLRAQDLGDYYRIVADNRDLNYDLYYSEGIPPAMMEDGYTSGNTHQLSVDELIEVLSGLKYIQQALADDSKRQG